MQGGGEYVGRDRRIEEGCGSGNPTPIPHPWQSCTTELLGDMQFSR